MQILPHNHRRRQKQHTNFQFPRSFSCLCWESDLNNPTGVQYNYIQKKDQSGVGSNGSHKEDRVLSNILTMCFYETYRISRIICRSINKWLPSYFPAFLLDIYFWKQMFAGLDKLSQQQKIDSHNDLETRLCYVTNKPHYFLIC